MLLSQVSSLKGLEKTVMDSEVAGGKSRHVPVSAGARGHFGHGGLDAEDQGGVS